MAKVELLQKIKTKQVTPFPKSSNLDFRISFQPNLYKSNKDLH